QQVGLVHHIEEVGRLVAVSRPVDDEVKIGPRFAYQGDELLGCPVRKGGLVVIHHSQIALGGQRASVLPSHRDRFFIRLKNRGCGGFLAAFPSAVGKGRGSHAAHQESQRHGHTGQLIQNFSHGSSLFVLAPMASSAVGFGVVWAFCCSRAASCSGVRFATRTISATSTFSASAIRRSSSSMRLFSWMRRSLAFARSARSLSSFSLIVHLPFTWESCQNPAGVCPNNLSGCSSI